MPLKNNEEISHANSINLPDFLISQGENLVKTGHSYHFKEHDSLVVQDNKWYWNSRHIGGNNIKFIQEYYGKSFPEAVDILNGNSYARTSSDIYKNEVKPLEPQQKPVVQINIDEDVDKRRVIAYLTKTRGLEYGLVIDMIKQGLLTQDIKGNCVFLAKDDKGMTVGAELTGTSTFKRYKGIVPNSAYGYGCSPLIGKGENVLFFESSIDMLSYIQMFKKELDNHRFVSLIGLKSGTIQRTLERFNILPEKACICVDNDEAGKNFTTKMIEKYPTMQRISPIKLYKDWNEQLKENLSKGSIDFIDLKRYNIGGTEKMDIKTIKKTYTEAINNVISNTKSWEDFLRFSAKLRISESQDRHNFATKLLVYKANPKATECYSFKEWKNVDTDCHVSYGCKGIPVLTTDHNSKPLVTHIFDVKDTNKPNREFNHNISDDERLEISKVLNLKYGVDDYSLENQLANIIHNEVGKLNLEDKSIAIFIEKSIGFEMFNRFGFETNIEPDFFNEIQNIKSIKDFAEIGIRMNEIAVPLEKIIEKTLATERSIKHGELQGQRRNGIHMVRGSEPSLSDVSTRLNQQDVVQTRYRNLDISSDAEIGGHNGGHRQVWNNENEIPQPKQTSRVVDPSLGRQINETLQGNQRASSEPDRTDSRAEVEIRGVQESHGRLYEDSSTTKSVSNGSRGNDSSDNDILINDNTIKTAKPDKKGSAVSVSSNKITNIIAPIEVKQETITNPLDITKEDTPSTQNRNNFHITDEYLGNVGAKTKYQNNINAIKLLNTLDKENRMATDEEKEILSKYVGWGGLSQVFDESNTSWNSQYSELKNILTQEDYEVARASTLDAFYTSPIIIDAIYKTLDNLGFTGGTILEPAMGIGNFFGRLPQSMHDSKLFGVELDNITGKISKQLYPDADISINGFEKMKFENNSFDVAIGNVPFGNYSLNDKTKSYKNLKIHDYFFMKSLDKIRPGGVIAFITSKGTLDKTDSKVRKMLAQKSKLLGAIRLPDNAFKSNAGTEVTSDIIFLQKREKPLKESELQDCNWIHIGKSENGLPINQYFEDNPQMILGTLDTDFRYS